MSSSTGVGPAEFERLLSALLGTLGRRVEVTISGARELVPLVALRGAVGSGLEAGGSDQIVFDVGDAADLVLDRETVRRWWREGETIYVDTAEVRLAISRR